MTKEFSKKTPSFLSGSPSGEDKFEGKSQQKLATIITQLIKDDSLEKKVIGLEGEWGAGKSNVIAIIEKELGENYTTFLFDAWGHQEDLTRKAFLEELIDQLFLKNFLKDTEKWKQKKNELLAKKTVSTKQLFPKVQPYWMLFTFGILLFTFLSAFYTHVLKDFDFITDWNVGWLKPLISIFIIPAIPIFWAIRLAFKTYKDERQGNLKRPPLEQENEWQTLSRIFYWLKGDQLETEEKQNVIEDDPTVRQFREYFNLIQTDIGNKGLVIIFDNLDRLEHEKVRALWSSIHTFFAEESYDKTWVIVPYYKEKLIEIFEAHESEGDKRAKGKGFIEKTFALNFRVSPPIASDWDNLLREKLHEAFGGDMISEEEFPYLISIFDFLTPDSTIKPRQIINYVNELVALYKLWEDTVDKGEIKFRYLALFIMTRDEILLHPVDNILKREYLGESESLFARDENLDNIISALTFNVPRSLADEVLLRRELEQSIRIGSTDSIKNSMSHKAFQKYFIEAFQSVAFSVKRRTLSIVIQCVSEILPNETIESYWEGFAKDIGEAESEFESFKQDYKDILIHVPERATKRKLLKLLLQGHTANLSTEDNQRKYFNLILEIQEFLTNSTLDVDVLDLLTDQIFNPKPFLDSVQQYGADYGNLKISCSENALIDYLYDDDKAIKDGLVFENLDSLILVKDELDTKRVIEDIGQIVKTTASTKSNKVLNALTILKSLTSETLSLTLPQQTYEQFTIENSNNSTFADAFAIAISDFSNAHISGNFQNTLNTIDDESLEGVVNVIERYIDYGVLLNLIISNGNARNYPSLKKIAYKLTVKGGKKSRLILSNCLKDFSKIIRFVFDNDDQKVIVFVRRLNAWSHLYSSSMFDNIDTLFFKYFSIKDIGLVESIVSDAQKHIKELDDEALLSALKDQNRDFVIVGALFENHHSLEFTDHFYKAYENYLNEIFDGEEEIPSDDFRLTLLPSILDGRILKGLYTRIREKILSSDCDLHQLGIERVAFFLPGLINHGKLDNKAEAVSYKLVDYLFEEAEGIKLFTRYLDFFIEAVKNSGDYFEGAKMSISRNLTAIEDEDIKKRLRKELKLKTVKPEE